MAASVCNIVTIVLITIVGIAGFTLAALAALIALYSAAHPTIPQFFAVPILLGLSLLFFKSWIHSMVTCELY